MPSAKIVRKLRCKLGTENDLLRCLMAEFLGTFILVALVDGAAAGKVTSGGGSYLWGAFGSGFGVAFGIWSAYGVSGGHVNPAISIGLAVTGKFPWKRFPFYALAQLAGAFTASVVCFLIYLDGINYIDGGDRQVFDHANATCVIFTTFPAEYITLTTGFFEQVVNTGLMLGLVHTIGDQRNAGPVPSLAPLFYGLIVFSVILSYGINTGAPLNPARDLTGRIMCAIAGYGSEVWAPYGVQWWWIPTFGPLVGGAVGSLIYLLLIEIHHHPDNPGEDCLKPSAAELKEITDAENNVL